MFNYVNVHSILRLWFSSSDIDDPTKCDNTNDLTIPLTLSTIFPALTSNISFYYEII